MHNCLPDNTLFEEVLHDQPELIKEILSIYDYAKQGKNKSPEFQLEILEKIIQSSHKILVTIENEAIEEYNRKLSEAQKIASSYFTHHMPNCEKNMEKAHATEKLKI